MCRFYGRLLGAVDPKPKPEPVLPIWALATKMLAAAIQKKKKGHWWCNRSPTG